MNFFPHSKPRDLCGFTLLETLVSLSIIAILIAISLPAARHFMIQTQDEILLQKILNAIQLAKVESQIRHVQTALCKSKSQIICDGEWEDGQLVFIDENDDGVIQTREQIISVIQTTSSHGNLYWRSFPFYRNYLSFSPIGFMKSDNGTLWHCHSSSPIWAIMINKMGRTRVAYPDANGEIIDGRGKLLICNPKAS